METYFEEGMNRQFEAQIPRAHPWSTSVSSRSQQYVNLKLHPELVETSLEDFAPFKSNPSVRSFFDLLRRINQKGGLLETNDCGCKPPKVTAPSWKQMGSFEGLGRLMFLFRNWNANLNDDYTESLLSQFGRSILDYPNTKPAVIGLHYAPVAFPMLPGVPHGRQVVAHWWCWGNSEEEVWGAFGEVCAALSRAVDDVEATIRNQCRDGCAADSPAAPFTEPQASD